MAAGMPTRDTQRGTANATETAMINLNHIDDLARRVSDMLPPGLRQTRDEVHANVKAALQAGLGKLDLVTREEFDVQRAVLLRTREKLDALELAVAALEKRNAPGSAPGSDTGTGSGTSTNTTTDAG